MAYKGKNFDPNYKAKQQAANTPKKDAVKPNKTSKPFTPPTDAQSCYLVDNRDKSKTWFASRNLAKKEMARLIALLPPKADPNEPDVYSIV